MSKIYHQSAYNSSLQKFIFSETHKKWLITLFMLFLSFIALNDPAFAQGFGKVESSLQKIVSALTGPIAKSIATISVVGVGIAWIAGYIEMRKAFFVCVGVGIVFGAPQIVTTLTS
ncbi:TrbC/VirB2 family protein [Bartonella sp. CB169]|uniref:TrbC/VirB2 family protein n=1 Tax=Bartonella sp. CB169 TaxID=3112257 RepID=UPI00300DF94B